LGGYGHPDDPIATAVDDTVAAGATVVVAAGNESWRPDDYANVTTPGVARRAVTVGASAKEDWMALFSSRGPVTWSGKAIVKPDLAAPGVSICAAQHAEAYASKSCGEKMIALSGTSMATPHVAGVAALVLQARPELTPDEVKATLTGSAVPLGTDTSAVRRGAGRVDALAAVRHGGVPPVAGLAPIATTGATRTISGTVRASGLRRWTLEVATFRGSLSAEWGWITLATGTTPPAGGVLKQLAIKTLPDGQHILRLTVEDASGRKAVDHGYTEIDKIGFTRPLDLDVHRAGGTEPVEVRVDPSVAATYTLEMAPGSQPEAWTTIAQGTQPPFSWNTAGLAAGWYALRLTATHDGFSEQDRISVRLDPRLRPGWPLRIPVDTAIPCVFTQAACSSERGWIDPVAEDLDGDGSTEILFARFARTPEVRAYGQDGALRWSTPLGAEVSTSTMALEALSMPVVGDADGDGVKEIYAFNAIDERVYVLNPAGIILRSWAVETPVPLRNPRLSLGEVDGDAKGELVLSLDWARVIVMAAESGAEQAEWSVPGSGSWFYTVDATYQPAIGDLDGDGRQEIVAMNGNPARITAFAGDGRQLWSVAAVRGPAYVPPVIGDVDGDGDREVIAVSGGRSNGSGTEVHVLDTQGRELAGWPRSFSGIPQGGPVLTDLDGDGRRDVVLGFADSANVLRALRSDGTDVPGWPRTTNGVSFHPAVVGDADGDAQADVAIHENGGAYGEVRVSRADGTPVAGLVLGTEQTMRAPVLLTATVGGRVGVVASSDGDHYHTGNYTKAGKLRASVYLWELGATHRPGTMTWPTFQRDAGRTGSV
ncbi:MAG TPA: S8 family serine peptidase, partial [Actinomycetota bacterium]